MEQQNQQSIQEKTESKPPIKINWKYYIVIVSLVALVIGVGVVLILQIYQPEVEQVPPRELTGEVKIRGEVIDIDLTPMFVDGDGIVKVRTTDGTLLTIFVPAGERPCEADTSALFKTAKGSQVEIFGSFVDAETTLCESPRHYLRIVDGEEIDNSDWQTYRNDEFGFEVRYPTDWIVEIDALFFEDEIKSSKTESLITVLEMENSENLSFDDWVGKLSLLADDPLTRPIGEYATFINGVRAYRFDSYPSDRPFAEISEIFIESPTNRIFHIYATSAVREDRDVLNQILSTFRFVEKKPVIPADKQSCESKGGTWGKFGLAQVELCNLPTSDAGKECTDRSQCESVCIADSNMFPDTKTTGKCYGWTETLGTCLNYVNNGKAGGTLCAD